MLKQMMVGCGGSSSTVPCGVSSKDKTTSNAGTTSEWAKAVQSVHFCANPRDTALDKCLAVTDPQKVTGLLQALGALNNTMGILGGRRTQAKRQNFIVFTKRDGSTVSSDFIDPTLRLKVGGQSSEYEISDAAAALIRGYLRDARALGQSPSGKRSP